MPKPHMGGTPPSRDYKKNLQRERGAVHGGGAIYLDLGVCLPKICRNFQGIKPYSGRQSWVHLLFFGHFRLGLEACSPPKFAAYHTENQ